jgi:hypothetical protein
MKTIINTIFIFAMVLSLNSCKKGENDPSFSLQSRKARATGEWKLKEGSQNMSSSYAGGPFAFSAQENHSYTENEFTSTFVETGSPNYTEKGNYAATLSLKKDGNFVWEETMDGKLFTRKGLWNFNSGVGEQKGKQQLVLTIQTVIGNNNSANFSETTEVFEIRELRSKKIVLFNEITFEGPMDGGHMKYSLKKEYLFEQ